MTSDALDTPVAAIEKNPSETSSPRSLMRVLGLLDLLGKAPDGLSLAELSQALKAPKSSLLTLLRPLVADHYLSHTANRYHLGPPVFRLAASILSNRRFPKLIRPYMDDLAQRTGETVTLGTLDAESRRVIYIEVVDSTQTIRYFVPPGTSRALYASTAGRVLLAFQDDEWRNNYLKTEKLKAYTPDTMTDRSLLRKNIDEIRANGFGVGIGQMVSGAAAISAPVFGASGQVAAALMIGAPSDRLQASLEAYTEAIVEVASLVSGDLRSFGTIVAL